MGAVSAMFFALLYQRPGEQPESVCGFDALFEPLGLVGESEGSLDRSYSGIVGKRDVRARIGYAATSRTSVPDTLWVEVHVRSPTRRSAAWSAPTPVIATFLGFSLRVRITDEVIRRRLPLEHGGEDAPWGAIIYADADARAALEALVYARTGEWTRVWTTPEGWAFAYRANRHPTHHSELSTAEIRGWIERLGVVADHAALHP